MQISPLYFSHTTYAAPKIQPKVPQNQNFKKSSLYSPAFYYPLSFTGGKSLSLRDTKNQIKKYSNLPPSIEEEINATLNRGNPDNKTLIDIHRKVYGKLANCETLDEAKAKYPEFNDVIPDDEIKFSQDSFVTSVKNGEIEGFDPNKSVSLQLLQLYWGEGFSLNTLKEDHAGQDVYHSLVRLNIPRKDRVYGSYLKLSDKDYNTRYTTEISNRQRKFYEENPDKIYSMSNRQRQFYEENPDEKEKLSVVLTRAWNYREAAPIKKRMSKFMKNAGLREEDMSDVFTTSKKTRENLREFWKKNGWAKAQFSKCLVKSWQRQDELTELGLVHEPLYKALFIPTDLKKEVQQNVDKNSSHMIDLLNLYVMHPYDAERYGGVEFLYTDKTEAAAEVFGKYARANVNNCSQKLATSFDVGLARGFANLYKKEKATGSQSEDLHDIFRFWKREVFNKKQQGQKISANEIKDIYATIIAESVRSGNISFAKEIDSCIDNAYSKINKSTNALEASEDYVKCCRELMKQGVLK